jgi:cytochrome c-type protein NapC
VPESLGDRFELIRLQLPRPPRHAAARAPVSTLSLGFLTLGGFMAGVVFWGGFNTALEATNRTPFCVSCHEMRDNVFEELQGTIHFTNRSGVRAGCPDCHVPHEWTRKIARKMRASKEVWGHVFGSISTRDAFLDLRRHLAESEWTRMRANDSLECRNCHTTQAMDLSRQSPRAAAAHERSLFSADTDLHRLPQGHRAQAAGHVRRAGVAVGMPRAAPVETGSHGGPARTRNCRPLHASGAIAVRGASPGQSEAAPRVRPQFRHAAGAGIDSRRLEGHQARSQRVRARDGAVPWAATGASASRRAGAWPEASRREDFEHRKVVENLEPLDYLALSRRYAEVRIQALEQEIRGYDAAEQASDESTNRPAPMV